MSDKKTKQTESRPPRHVAVIMDGNGRWAQKRKLPRTAGHKKGADTVEEIVRAAADIGIEYLTMFGFSTENWKRPDSEVSTLMGLMRQYLKSKTAEMHKNNVKLSVIGDRSRLENDIVSLIEQAEELTRQNDGIQLIMAISYSGRWDLTQATKAVAAEVKSGERLPDDIDQNTIGKYLSTGALNVPDVDLMIRTSGEQRISNFVLWQSAYAELYFTDTYWPDFDCSDLEDAVTDFMSRHRRFGENVASA